MDTDKQLKALTGLVTDLQKEFGQGVASILGVSEPPMIPRWKLSSPKLSRQLGGGFPKGRIFEIFGPESSGKTTLSCFIAGQIQAQGGGVAFIDAENSLDLGHVQKVGFRPKEAIIVQPDSGEDALNIAMRCAESPLIDLVIVDSVSALVPKAEDDAEIGQQFMGLQARMMSQALRKMTAAMKSTNTTIIFINQIRMKIGVMFGNPETTSGGNALKFYASARLDIRRSDWIKNGEEVVGLMMKIKTAKSKVSAPMQVILMELNFDTGFEIEKEYLDFAVSFGIVEKSGSWYSYKKERLGQGKTKAIACLLEHAELFEEVKAQVTQMLTHGFLEEDVEDIIKEELVIEIPSEEEIPEITED